MIRFSAIIAVTCAALVFISGAGRAQDAPVTQYHVTQDTYGCVSPDATRALTDPSETRPSDSAWFKGVFANGKCVTITPRSPWKLVSRNGDLALMSYGGTIGPPGTYYMKVDELVDPLGHHPGDAAEASAAPPPATRLSQVPPSAAATGLAAQAALAPQPVIAGQPVGPAPSATEPASPWARIGWLMLLAAVIAGAVFLAWRLSPRFAGGRRRSPGYPLRLPDHVMADAKRLAEANGAPLDQFLATLIAERIGEMKAMKSQAQAKREFGT